MKCLRVSRKNHDLGFTLIELLIALTLTSFMSVFLIQITSQATQSLTKISNSAVSVQSAIRFSNLIKYDFSGSQEVYVHSNTAPLVGSNKSCTSFQSSTSTWNAPTGALPYVRGLFTLRVAEVSYSSGSEASPKWQQLVSKWVGYEIRQKAYTATGINLPNFELWRVTCTDIAGAPSSVATADSERLLNLGSILSSSVLTDQYIDCFDDTVGTTGAVTTTEIDCRAGASPGYDVSTSTRTDYYKFTLPYEVPVDAASNSKANTQSILKTLKSDEFKILRRRIDN